MINALNFLGNVRSVNFKGTNECPHTKPLGCDCFVKSNNAKVQEAIERVKKDVIEQAKTQGIEIGYAITPEGEIAHKTVGDSHHCTMKPQDIVPGAILVHGHPSVIPLSTTDVISLLESNAKSMTAFMPDGTHSTLTKRSLGNITPRSTVMGVNEITYDLDTKMLDYLNVENKFTEDDFVEAGAQYLNKVMMSNFDSKTQREQILRTLEAFEITGDTLREKIKKLTKLMEFQQMDIKLTALNKDFEALVASGDTRSEFAKTPEGVKLIHEFLNDVAQRYDLDYETDF